MDWSGSGGDLNSDVAVVVVPLTKTDGDVLQLRFSPTNSPLTIPSAFPLMDHSDGTSVVDKWDVQRSLQFRDHHFLLLLSYFWPVETCAVDGGVLKRTRGGTSGVDPAAVVEVVVGSCSIVPN